MPDNRTMIICSIANEKFLLLWRTHSESWQVLFLPSSTTPLYHAATIFLDTIHAQHSPTCDYQQEPEHDLCPWRKYSPLDSRVIQILDPNPTLKPSPCPHCRIAPEQIPYFAPHLIKTTTVREITVAHIAHLISPTFTHTSPPTRNTAGLLCYKRLRSHATTQEIIPTPLPEIAPPTLPPLAIAQTKNAPHILQLLNANTRHPTAADLTTTPQSFFQRTGRNPDYPVSARSTLRHPYHPHLRSNPSQHSRNNTCLPSTLGRQSTDLDTESSPPNPNHTTPNSTMVLPHSRKPPSVEKSNLHFLKLRRLVKTTTRVRPVPRRRHRNTTTVPQPTTHTLPPPHKPNAR